MKKGVAITIGVVIVGVGAWLGSTWYTGQRIANDSAQQLEDLNAELARAFSNPDMRIEQLSTQRGFFSTQMRYALIDTAPRVPAAPAFMLAFDAQIDHGPLPLGALTRGNLLPSMAFAHITLAQTPTSQPMFDAAQGKMPLSADIVLHYDGNASVQAETAAMTFTEPVNAQFGSARFDGTVLSKLRGVEGTLFSEGLSMSTLKTKTQAEMQIDLGRTELKLLTQTAPSGLLQVGSVELKLASLGIANLEDDTSLQLHDLTHLSNSQEHNGLLNGELSYRFGSMVVNGAPLGSQQLTATFSRLNSARLSDLYERYIRSTRANSARNGDSQDFTPQQTQQLGEAAMLLLADKPSFALEPFIWKNDKGSSQLNLSVTLNAPTDATTSVQMLRQVVQQLDAKLVLSKPMVTALVSTVLQTQGYAEPDAARQANRQVNSIASMALMLNLGKVQNDDIVSTMRFDHGKLQLNGKAMPLDALPGLLPD